MADQESQSGECQCLESQGTPDLGWCLLTTIAEILAPLRQVAHAPKLILNTTDNIFMGASALPCLPVEFLGFERYNCKNIFQQEGERERTYSLVSSIVTIKSLR